MEHLSDKTRTRRMILKKLKDMGLMFKAPTKRSTANAANKHLWRSEEDEELQSLYDEHRLQEDCLQRIVNEFADRRTKRQIIQRLLQLHIIADKSEIMPKKQRKRKSKKKTGNIEGTDDEDGVMEEPVFGELEPTSGSTTKSKTKNKLRKNKNKQAAAPKPSKPVERKVVRTPLDVGTVRALIAQVTEKYQDSIDWLKECLDDAGDETEEPNEEDDGVPLVPVQESAREAMENVDFQKILVALGIQPPLLGSENYWRIPVYLNSADLKLRAKIVAGEDIEIDMEGIEDEGEGANGEPEEGSGNENEDSNDSESESESDASGALKQDSESEEDFFDNFAEKHKKRMAAMDSFIEKRSQKMRSIMFNKSDEEDTERAGIGQKKKRQRKPKEQEKKLPENSEDEATQVDEIKRKLDKKRRQPAISSDDEDEHVEKLFTSKSRFVSTVKKAEAPIDLFDQLKSKTDDKKREETTYTDELEELNFNSEDYRKRLLELGDSDEEDIIANENVSSISNNKTRVRRANIIDSDSEDENQNENGKGKVIDGDKNAEDVSGDNKGVNKASAINDNDGTDDKEVTAVSVTDTSAGPVVEDNGFLDAAIVDKTNNQVHVGDITTAAVDAVLVADEATLSTTTNKRKRGDLNDSDEKDGSFGLLQVTDDEVEDTFIARRKPNQEEQQRLASGEGPAKRRRIAIIADEDDDE